MSKTERFGKNELEMTKCRVRGEDEMKENRKKRL